MDIKEWGLNGQLGIDIWNNKYKQGDETFDEWLDRISNGDEELRQLIVEKKFLFGGRILANRGMNKHGRKITYSNCYVLPRVGDSIESIYQTCSDLARTFSYSGGVGIDISQLRPKGAKVNNASESTSGATSFMETFSQVTETIGMNGRRAALMISMDVNHPEVEDFINIKTDLNKVTKANISIRVDDEFMHKVLNNETHICKFTVEDTGEIITKEYNARELFMRLCKNNHNYAEPGILYWSRIENYNMLSEDKEFSYAGVNPCFTGDMKLLTANGFKTLKELCGTQFDIVSYDGKISKGKVWCNGEKNTIKLVMSNGREIICTPDHRFMTIEGEECQAKDLKNKKIMPSIFKTIPNNELFIKLGFIQGDGQLSRLNSEWHDGVEVNIGMKDGDIRYLFEDDEYTEKSYRAIYLQGYNDILENFGFSQEVLPYRTMPKAYNEWDLNKKSNFLQGCFSANGCVNSNRRISYKTTCKDFALELIQTLKNDFGITANLTVNKKHMVEFANGEYECRESYDVNINKYDDILLFAQFIGFYQTYKTIKLNNLIKERVPYVRSIKENGRKTVYDFKEPINHWGIIEGYVAHNCAEECLPAGGSCLLGSFNLNAYIRDKKFDLEQFKHDIHIVVKAMNDVLDEGLPLHPLQVQRDTVRDYRQIGIGIMGIADMLINMEIKYGSEESIDLCEVIGFTLANESLKASSLLAKEEGAYPKFKVEEIMQSEFIQKNTTEVTRSLINTYGLRNSQVLTIAPTGSISTMLGISGGIEPIFANSYTRKTESLHGDTVFYKVYTPIVDKYMKEHGLTEEEELPDFFVTSATLNPLERVEMQGIWQDHIDASISSTVNLPYEATVEDVYDIYVEAWKRGLKGITIYRSGCKREGVLTLGNEQVEEVGELQRGDWKSLADDTYYVKRPLLIGCGKLKLFIGYSPSEQAIQDLYIVKCGNGGCTKNLQALAISMSAILRLGGNLEQIERAFSGIEPCNSFIRAKAKGQKLSQGTYCGSAILNEVKAFLKQVDKQEVKQIELKLTQQEALDKNLCPDCGEELEHIGGCVQCKCGFTKCD